MICDATFWLSLLKTCFGIICFVLLFLTSTVSVAIYPKFCYGFTAMTCNVRRQILEVACTAFPFIIEPTLILTTLYSAQKPPNNMRTLLNLFGLVTYLTGGVIILSHVFEHPYLRFPPSANVTGSFFITTAIFYLSHLGHSMYRRYMDDDYVLTEYAEPRARQTGQP